MKMKIVRGFKTELAPNNVQRSLLARTAGCARFAYNWGLGRRIEEYQKTGKSSSAIDQHKQLNSLKATEFPWMYDVSKCAPQEALRDLDKAYQGFFRRVKAGEKPGFPKFKNKHKSEPKFKINSKCAVSANKIHLPHIGWVKLKERGYLPMAGDPSARQLTVTVKGTGSGRWFVSVQCEVEAKDPVPSPLAAKVIGIDLGLKDYAILSDGSKPAKPPKSLRKAMKKLRREQRKVARRQKSGSNRLKAVRRVNATHFRVASLRREFIHQLTSWLVKTKPALVYVVEDLNIKGMMKNHCLAHSIADVGWGEFLRQLAYKSSWNGYRVVKADRWFPSSKMCSGCHQIHHALKLSDRVFICPHCGLVIDRDVNAAINLSRYEEYVAAGIYVPKGKAKFSRDELPPVRREVTPGERKGRKQPRGARKKTQAPMSGKAAC
jgi:putative transposase